MEEQKETTAGTVISKECVTCKTFNPTWGDKFCGYCGKKLTPTTTILPAMAGGE